MNPEGSTDRPVPPWPPPGAVRRDCEPHRGRLVVLLGQAAFTLSFSLAVMPLVISDLPRRLGREFPAWGLPLFPLAGTLPSLAAWALARHDLALIRRGRMDPAGERPVRDGRWFAAAGMVLAALGFCVSILVGCPPGECTEPAGGRERACGYGLRSVALRVKRSRSPPSATRRVGLPPRRV